MIRRCCNQSTNLCRLALTMIVGRGELRREEGQSTVEYALVVLAAATIALLVIAWAASTGKIGQLLDRVFDQVVAKAG